VGKPKPSRWKLDKPWHNECQDVIIDDKNNLRIIGPNRVVNAAYVVKCVNMHDELVEALDDAVNTLLSWEGDDDDVARFLAVLAKATGGAK
jgi:hypothetical protein